LSSSLLVCQGPAERSTHRAAQGSSDMVSLIQRETSGGIWYVEDKEVRGCDERRRTKTFPRFHTSALLLVSPFAAAAVSVPRKTSMHKGCPFIQVEVTPCPLATCLCMIAIRAGEMSPVKSPCAPRVLPCQWGTISGSCEGRACSWHVP
jgi:hypothetical protein